MIVETETTQEFTLRRLKAMVTDGGYSLDNRRAPFTKYIAESQKVALVDAEAAVRSAEIELGITQAPVAVTEPAQEESAEPQQEGMIDLDPEPTTPTPIMLTKKEIIEIVKGWSADNDSGELSHPWTAEEMVEELREIDSSRVSEGCPASGLDDQFPEIVKKYAPNAHEQSQAIPAADGVLARNAERVERPCQTVLTTDVPCPPELSSLITEDKVWYEPMYEHWVIKRCQKCGELGRDVCCGEPTRKVSVCDHKSAVLNNYGKQAAGLIPIKRPAPPKPVEQIWKESDWWRNFRGVDELQGDGNVSWVIQNVVPAGVTVLTAMPKDGKSFVALSFVRAITTGQPWLGRIGFEVPEPMPVLWLAAESGDSSLKIRCKKFGITEDKSRFICRTLTEGMVDLDDPELQKLVKAMKPYIVLETLVRFGDAQDEDDAKEASHLAKLIFQLIAWGAQGVLAIHHSRKDLKRGGVDMEKAVRGSGDYAALADAIWVIVRDEYSYRDGKGVNEISLSGWGRDFNPYPMRLALTRKAPADLPKGIITFAPGIVSVLDETHDLGWVDQSARVLAAEAADQTVTDKLEQMVQTDPKIALRQLAEAVGLKYDKARSTLADLGWTKSQRHGDVWKKVKAKAA